jgi:salicylate hydroxylase
MPFYAILYLRIVPVISTSQYMPDTSQWAIFEQPHISCFCKSRVAILGDAAHASTPHSGAGAGQAVEDAHVLVELLSDTSVQTADHVVAAFKAYDAVRRPRSQRVVTSSKENAELACLCYKGIGDDAEKLREMWDQRFKWLWDIDIQEQAENARKVMLQIIKDASKTRKAN